jgi:hypothetical protein
VTRVGATLPPWCGGTYLPTKASFLASDNRADIGGMIVDIQTRAPRAYTVVAERMEYHALDPTIASDLDFLTQSGIGDWGLGTVEPHRG